jgi:hypothetical protein
MFTDGRSSTSTPAWQHRFESLPGNQTNTLNDEIELAIRNCRNDPGWTRKVESESRT